ncbi:MAG TPA: molybdopterin-dependent oxidoreductase [Sphingobium sp.]|nr:molybdopterin-dependent oxidoreductase [Sphingobium sp.]
MTVVRTLCGQCSVGCGVRAMTGEGRDLSFAGDPVHPANSGLLCAGSEAIDAMVPLDGRLLHPMLNGQRVSWDRIIGQAARRLKDVLHRHGPGSVAMHVAGGLLTEDYYVANKLMKGFIGSAHIDCGSSGGPAADIYRKALGEDAVPGTFEDIDQAELIMVPGEAVLRKHPVLADRVQAAREEGAARLILLDDGADAEEAIPPDIRLNIAPGSAAVLLNGLLLHCHERGLVDTAYLDRHVVAPDDFWARLRQGHDLWSVARRCGLQAAELRAFYDLVGAGRRVVTLLDDGDAGLLRAVVNLHVSMEWIGRPGAAPFAVARDSNAMGAREVGCGNDQLAAHREFSEDALSSIARFWSAPHMAGVAGLSDDELADAIERGVIKALLIVGGLASEHRLTPLLAKVPLVIMTTPWTPDVDVKGLLALPSPVWIEKDGTATGADRLISRQRRLFPLPGEAKPDWWSLTQIARAMGWADAFHYERAAEIYREHVRLTGYHNGGERLLDLRRHAPISNPAYDELTPWRWGGVPFDGGCFPTADGRARLLV